MTAVNSRSRARLADLIDLELQLERDKDADIAELRARDAKIGEAICAESSQSPSLFLDWLDALPERGRSGQSVGLKVQHFVELAGFALFVAGLIFGAAAVATWLAYNTDRPVNVIFFWSALVGVQILLLLGWAVAMLPRAWISRIPGIRGLQVVLRGIARVPPMVLTWIASWCSRDVREMAAMIRGQARRMDWLYGKLALWLLVKQTQTFAVAFNLGAIAAFLAISYGNDPTFGWKSTMLSDEAMNRGVRVVSAPWAAVWPEAVPTLEDVKATRYSSLDDRFVGRSQQDRAADVRLWASWWPFLLASLLVYGLGPRVLTWLLCNWQVRRQFRNAKLDHHEFQKLADRLRRPAVDTRAVSGSEIDGVGNSGDSPAMHKSLDLSGRELSGFKWAGVQLPDESLSEILRARFGAVAKPLLCVGQLDASQDAAAISQFRESQAEGPVAVVVEAWEPPIADYVDFIEKLRAAAGDGVLILVLLYHHDVAGNPAAPTAADLEIWQRQLSRSGDPWLVVEALVEEAPTAGAHAAKESGV